MIKGISKKDNILLFISNHRFLCRVCACIQFVRLKVGFNKEFRMRIEQTMNVFLKNDAISNGGGIFFDILYSYYRNMIQPKEYFYYNFYALNDQGRKNFVGITRLVMFWHKLWDEKTCEIYENKYMTYQKYRKYYGREVIHISHDSDFAEFYSFTQRHPRFIVKPLSEYGGQGVHIAKVDSSNEALMIFDEISADGETVVEELVAQAPEMARYYPYSVNTIRFVTFYHKGRLSKICAVLRMGRNGSEVDNATYGGIFAPIDLEHGVVYAYAGSYKGEKYAFHPDTGVQILGTKIPRWDELNSLIEELVKLVPQQKMVGWDMALARSGWVMIEANHNPASQELVYDHGLREAMHDVYEAFYG